MSSTRALFVTLLRGFVFVWTALACVVIFIGYAAVWWHDGFSALAEVLPTPWNPWSVIANLITVSPAIGAQLLAERLGRTTHPIAP